MIKHIKQKIELYVKQLSRGIRTIEKQSIDLMI